MNRDHQTIRAAITNEVIRAVAALRQQRTVAREQDGQTVFVPGTEAAREYLIATLDRALAGDSTPPATGQREGVWNPNGEGQQPDIPGGVAKDHARAKQPVIAYACLYPKLAAVAREHGYALAMHGSLVADCDLIAVPWVENAAPGDDLARALAAAAAGHLLLDTCTARPAGVRKHIIHLGGGPYIDLAVCASDPPAVSGEGERQGNYYGHRLTAGVSDGRVVIAVGVETLAHAVAYADWSNPFDDAADEYIRTFAIADAPQFAKDMVSAMLAEREDGSTPLSEFLDSMAQAAIEDGSLGLDEAEYRIKHGEHAPCETWARASTPTPGAPR